MHPLPLKWKIFRVANYLHMSGAMAGVLTMLYLFFAFGSGSLSDMLALLVFVLVFGTLITHCIINLYLLDKCYPDKLYSRRLVILSIIIFILTLVLIAGMIIIFSYGLYRTLGQQRTDVEGNIALLLFGVLIVTGIYISWLQVALKKTIRKNYQQSMDNFLNTDNPE